jgi:hypothetical protein
MRPWVRRDDNGFCQIGFAQWFKRFGFQSEVGQTVVNEVDRQFPMPKFFIPKIQLRRIANDGLDIVLFEQLFE